MADPERHRTMPLATRIRELRESKGFSLEDLASRAKISKTYLWELERDTAGAKKPSADILMRIANALSTTIADLMSLPSVRVHAAQVQEIPASLKEFRDRMKQIGSDLSDADVQDLAQTRFRGGQPQTADEWHALYLVLASASRKPRP
jgi:transcriptional regulator with XRE-family HTH domain